MAAPRHPSTPDDGDQFEQRFRLLVESLTDYAVFMIDLSGTIASWNPGVKLVLGYDAEEFIGLPFASIFTPDDVARNQPAQELERARTTGRSDDKRMHVRKDGTRFPADGVVTTIRDDTRNVQAFSKVMHDVSVQHRASEALRQSEERYRLLVENVRDYAIFLLDPDGVVASWTREAERIKGYAAEEIIGQHFRVFFTSDDQRRGAPEQELRTAVVAGRSEGEGWRVRKDGSRFWGDEIVAPIRDESGQLRGFAKIVRDLTERQRAALEREQLYTQAQEASRLKDEFLGTVSHELRTPLNAILGWAHLLELKGLDLDETRRERAIRTIARNAQIQVQLVDDLLDVSRIISGKMRLQIQTTNLSEVLQAAVEAVRPAASAKGVDLRVGPLHATRNRPRRCRSAAADCVESVVERNQVHACRRLCRAAHRAIGADDRDHRQRQRDRYGLGCHPVRVRSIPSGGQLDHAAPRWRRTRARHRAASRRTARRQRERGERGAGHGFNIHCPPARGES